MKGMMKVLFSGDLAILERMEDDKIAKREYVRKCAGSHPVERQGKRWIDT